MELQELNNKIKEAKREFENKRSILMKEYALANNPYKEGDVFTDHIGSIKIDTIRVALGDIPCCVYYGVELKKDGTPVKSGKTRDAYQSNDINRK